MNAYQELEAIFVKLSHLEHADAILNWDEATMMPIGGGHARSEALATLCQVRHDMLTSTKVLDLLSEAEFSPPKDSWQSANLKNMSRQYHFESALPAKLKSEITLTTLQTSQLWRQLRAENDWDNFAPQLAKVVDLTIEAATIQGEKLNLDVYDVLIDHFSPGMNQVVIDPVFTALREHLPPLIQEVMQRQATVNLTEIEGKYPIERQQALGIEVMKLIGFDFNHGRLDISHHPFCGGVPQDVRLTTRYDENDFISSLMGICHETGHAMYERQLPKSWSSQPVGKAMGMTIHESQSLLIEMQTCRSDEFIEYLSTQIPKFFEGSDTLNYEVLLQNYRVVRPGLIRVDADEVTYPMHVIMRYEIEKSLINKSISVSDLPEIWQNYMKEFLGIDIGLNYKDGVMQDVHWPSGAFGYFPAYTLGALFAAQQFEVMTQQHPKLLAQLRKGDFTEVMSWLGHKIHQKGSIFNTPELIFNATGKPLSIGPFMAHVRARYLN